MFPKFYFDIDEYLYQTEYDYYFHTHLTNIDHVL